MESYPMFLALILLKYPQYPNQSPDSMQFLSNPSGIFCGNRKNNPKICMDHKRPQKSEKSNLRLYCKVILKQYGECLGGFQDGS
jgi:hypothetical protein